MAGPPTGRRRRMSVFGLPAVLLITAAANVWGQANPVGEVVPGGELQDSENATEKLVPSLDGAGPGRADVEAAIGLFRNQDFAGARRLLESARTKDSRLPPVGVMLAQLLFAANQTAAARAELERVVKGEPNDPEPYVLFGEVAFQQRQFTEADLLFAKARDMCRAFTANPQRQKNLNRRANFGSAAVAEVREDWQTAQQYLKAITQEEPEEINAGTRLARTMFQLGDYKGAYEQLGKLWATDSSITRPEVTMGMWYEQSGKRANASQLMTRALERDGTRLETVLAVARWALDAGDLDLAKDCADRAAKLDPNSMDAKLVQGLVARYQKNYTTARTAYESAHVQSPSHLAAMLQLALVLLEQPGSEQVALEYAQTAARVYSDLSQNSGRESAVTLAWVLFRLGRTADAQRALQQVLNAGTISPEGAYFAARILQQGGNTEAAGKLLQTALLSDPAFPNRSDADRLLQQLTN